MTVADNLDEALYLGVDPGSSKTGLALVNAEGKIMRLHIARTESLAKELPDFCGSAALTAVIIGNGTHSQTIAQEIKQLLPELPVHFVEEAYSTEAARKLYWEVNPPKGWQKFVPLGLLVPSEPLDAYAAVVQVRRWLEK